MSMGSGHSTVGAGKSGARSSERFGPDAPWFWWVVGLGLFVISPAAIITFLALAFGTQVRRVRASRILLIAAISAVIALLAARLNPVTLVQWHLHGLIDMWGAVGVIDLLNSGLEVARNNDIVGWPDIPQPRGGVVGGFFQTCALSVPLGAIAAAALSAWMTYRRSSLTGLEGREYDWTRPNGVLDKARARRSANRIIDGGAVDRKRRRIGVGVGRYGALVWLCVDNLIRPTLVFGGPRTGKTASTMSMLTQAMCVPGPKAEGRMLADAEGYTRSGILVVDFKGDGEIPDHYAEFAATHGRNFRHFILGANDGSPYRQPHPDVPDTPACYDPIRRGNATTKTDMLVNSVGREGDAQAYFRAAYEVSQVAFQVAAVSGYDRDKGGFQVLQDLLNVDYLGKIADSSTLDAPEHQRLRQRVETLQATFKGDNLTKQACYDLSRLLSTYANGPAAGPYLSPDTRGDNEVDIRRAVLNGDVVVFSLPVQNYGNLAKNIGTLVMLDLQNVITELRTSLDRYRASRNDPRAKPPWAPFYVEIEEFGSAGPESVLGVLNKAGDVRIRPVLSTQSWHDIAAIDGNGVFAKQVLDQAGNIMSFSLNEGTGAEVLSSMTPEVSKQYPRDRREFKGGVFGIGLRAANTGAMEVTREQERQVPTSAFQNLIADPDTGTFQFIWITKTPGTRVTHTYKAHANHWYEVLKSQLVPPSILPDTSVVPRMAEGAPRREAEASQPHRQHQAPKSTGPDEEAPPPPDLGDAPQQPQQETPPPKKARPVIDVETAWDTHQAPPTSPAPTEAAARPKRRTRTEPAKTPSEEPQDPAVAPEVDRQPEDERTSDTAGDRSVGDTASTDDAQSMDGNVRSVTAKPTTVSGSKRRAPGRPARGISLDDFGEFD